VANPNSNELHAKLGSLPRINSTNEMRLGVKSAQGNNRPPLAFWLELWQEHSQYDFVLAAIWRESEPSPFSNHHWHAVYS
jgi:hypothetical protein